MVIAAARQRRVAFSEESTFGTAPTSWDSAIDAGTAYKFFVVDPNVDGLKQEMLENNNSVSYAQQRHKHVLGLKSKSKFSFGAYLHGNSATAALDAQAAEFHISRLVKNSMSGQLRSYRKNVNGGTTTSLTLTNATNITPGMWFFVAPTNGASGSFAQVTSGSGAVVQIRPPLPFVPTSGSTVAYACVSCYIDEDSMYNNSDAQHTTLSMVFRGGDDEDIQQVVGTKLGLEIDGIEAGGVGILAKFDGMACNFSNSGITGSTCTLTGSTLGDAPRSTAGTAPTFVYFGNYSGTLSSIETRGQIAPKLGTKWEQMMGANATAGLQGVHRFVAAGVWDAGLEMTVPYSSSYAVEVEALTEKSALVQIDNQVGRAFAMYFPRLEYDEDTARGVSQELISTPLKLRALDDDTAWPVTGDSLYALRSKVQLVFVA